MDAEQRGLRLLLVGQRDLGEDLVTAQPRGLQPLEHRPVPESCVDQALVQVLDLHGLGTGWWPLDRSTGSSPGPPAPISQRRFLSARFLSARFRSEDADGVPGPRFLRRGVLAARVHRHRAPARLVGSRHGHLQLQAGGLRQHERRLQGQLVHDAQPASCAGAHRELDERGAGHDDRAQHDVVGQPRVGGQREPPGEHEHRPESGSATDAPSSGCSAAARPGRVDVTAPASHAVASSAGAGRRTSAGRPGAPVPANSAGQSTGTPRTWTWASAVVTASASGRSLRSAGANTASPSTLSAAATVQHAVRTDLEERGGTARFAASARRRRSAPRSRTWRTQYVG